MMPRAVLLSGLCHGLLALALLIHVVPGPPPPLQYAEVELIQQNTPSVGDGPVDNSQQDETQEAAAPPPVTPTPSDQPAPPVPEAQAAPAPPATPAPDVPMPPPPVPQPNQQLPTPAAPSPPRPQATAAQRPSPPPAPPPAPDTRLPEGDPGGAPSVRLGDGDVTGTGLVENVIPAAVDSKVHNKVPHYPAESARLGEEGTVTLLVHVNTDGSPAAVDVQEGSGHDRLDQAAREAVAHWQFRPARQGGMPVVSQTLIRVRFVIKG